MIKMGACMSTNDEETEQKKRSQKIDRDLEEDSKKLRKECKILLLGGYSRDTFFGLFVLTCARVQAPARAVNRPL